MAAKKTIELVDLASGKSAKTEVPTFFDARVSLPLVAQAVHVLNQRTRVRKAHSKGRAEVRGGGRKPWAQKGTGRARHGSRRSPLWTGGGVTFGPHSRKEESLTLSRKEKSQALAAAFTVQMRAGTAKIVKVPEKMPEKTKDAAKMFGDAYSVLFITHFDDAGLARFVRNLPGVVMKRAEAVTVSDVVRAGHIWIEEKAVEVIAKRCEPVNEKIKV